MKLNWVKDRKDCCWAAVLPASANVVLVLLLGELPVRQITEILIGTQVIQFQEVTRMLNVYADRVQHFVQCL